MSGGFSGTYSTAAGGSDSTATWTTAITSADQGKDDGTEVSATWVPSVGNATNATYEIYDGSSTSGTLLGTVTVNQTIAPVGTADGNTQFQELGDYYPQSGTLTVVLQASGANGTVVADAVGIAPGSATGGGQSEYESEPSYQLSVQDTGFRMAPDVSFDGSNRSGVTVYEDGAFEYDHSGTSLATPCWAGLIAIADQGREAYGGTAFDSPTDPTQALLAIYSLPSADFNQVTTGYNGFMATSGYDELTGLGSPIANLLVPDLASYGLIVPAQLAITSPPPGTVTAGDAFGFTVYVEDSSGNRISDYDGTIVVSLSSDPTGATLGGDLTVSVVDGMAVVSGLTIDIASDGYALQATLGAFTTGASNDVDVIPAAAYQLVINTPPSSGATAGSSFATQPVIYEEDQYGNLEIDDNTTQVTASLKSGVGPLQGTVTVTVVGGVATFTNLADNTAETISLEFNQHRS